MSGLVRLLHGNLLGLLAVFVIERPLRCLFRDGKAHLDTREAWLSCRAVWSLPDRDRSWRQGGQPQPVNEARDPGEQSSRDSDLGHQTGLIPIQRDSVEAGSPA